MMLRALRPVGEPVPVFWREQQARAAATDWPSGFSAAFYASGTAALAAALRAAIRKDHSASRRVLIPAYCCPDLVSATLYAGGVPTLVDTQPDSPFMDLRKLADALSQGAAAVVAAHFLGLGEKVEAIRGLCQSHGLPLIEDSAQRLLSAGNDSPRGDFVVLSFGRGKPPSGIGGGCLLVSDPWRSDDFEAMRTPRSMSSFDWYRVQIRSWLSNQAMRPEAYAFVRRLPGTGLGQTRYRRLRAIEPIDEASYAVALAVLARQSMATAAQQRLPAILAEHADVLEDLVKAPSHTTRLLRYPVLFRTNRERDKAYRALNERGFGVSYMYGRALCDMPDVPGLDGQCTPTAQDFARRLMTLPVHEAVTERDLDDLAIALRTSLRDPS